jgi:hypothetical protein
MLYYQQIDAIFGAPLNQAVNANSSFKLKAWHVILGTIILGLSLYGAKSMYAQYEKEKSKMN